MKARKIRRLAACILSGAVLAACGLFWAHDVKAESLPANHVEQVVR